MNHSATCQGEHPHPDPPRRAASGSGVLTATAPRAGSSARLRTGAWSLPEVRWAVCATALFAAGLLLHLAGLPGWATGIPFAACYLAGGWQPAVAGWQALRQRVLDVDLLMIVAALGAAAIGQVIDGGLLIVIFAASGAQEAYATKRTIDSVNALLTLAPEQASLVSPEGTETLVDTAALVTGDNIVIRPGERIGADGTVLRGSSEVDQASVTGEALPVLRGPGDEVFAGTLNLLGALHVRVDRPAGESVVARIVELVEQASATKATTQLFIDKIEQRYSVTVVLTTLLVFTLPLAFGEALRPSLLRAMTYMIVASPCAVVLATMPPLLSAIANAGRHGVLVKSAIVMEQLGRATLVCFDKTGTLTLGAPHLTATHPFTDLPAAEVLRLAASVEHTSEHPLGRAIVTAAAQHNLPLSPTTGFTATPGRGVSAQVDSQHIEVGKPLLLTDATPTQLAQVTALQTAGCTAVIVMVDGKAVGALALTDQLRPTAAHTVAALTSITGASPVLLTGDNLLAARTIAAQTGISTVHADLLPHEKASLIQGFRDQGHHVLVIGDGLNDAPALATANVGVAMGGTGSDLTVQTADAILIGDDLTTLPALIHLSRRARTAVVQNLVLAGATILALVAWDLLGTLPLPLGVLGHEGGTVLIGLNGLRLLRSGAGPHRHDRKPSGPQHSHLRSSAWCRRASIPSATRRSRPPLPSLARTPLGTFHAAPSTQAHPAPGSPDSPGRRRSHDG